MPPRVSLVRRNYSLGRLRKIREVLDYGSFDREREAAVTLALTTNVVISANEARLGSAPVWKQGDLSHYTDEAIKARAALRNEPSLIAVLEKYWNVALGGSGDVLNKAKYCDLARRLYRALTEEYDEFDCRQAVEDDWKEDAKGRDFMTRDMFLDAMFQLVDIWTESISLRMYIVFAECILRRITVEIAGELRWKPEQEIEQLPIGEDDEACRARKRAVYGTKEISSDEAEYDSDDSAEPLPDLRDMKFSLDKAHQKEINQSNRLYPLTPAERKLLPKFKEITHFDMNDLEIIARQYKTFCVKHTLDSPLAMQAFKSCVQQWGVMKSMSSLLFNVFDRDNSRSVDFTEYVRALSIFLRGTFAERVQLCFDLWDADQSGYLKRKELRNMLRSIQQGGKPQDMEDELEYVMSKLDHDQDGAVSFPEFLKGVNRVPVLNAMFRRLYAQS